MVEDWEFEKGSNYLFSCECGEQVYVVVKDHIIIGFAGKKIIDESIDYLIGLMMQKEGNK